MVNFQMLKTGTVRVNLGLLFKKLFAEMGSSASDDDHPLTPVSRLFLRPEINQIVHCMIGVTNPLDVDSVKSQILSSFLVHHPRFCSLLVSGRNGVQRWRRASMEIDRHVIVAGDLVSSCGGNDELTVNDYLAELVTSGPMDTSKPLWEIHLLLAQKCVIFRIHHALGDGISLMSLLLACCRRADDENAMPIMITDTKASKKKKKKNESLQRSSVGFLEMLWFSVVSAVEFALRSLCVSDRKTIITGGEGVELWPRKLVVSKFSLDDMKAVKKALPNATTNDVLFGVISYGLSKYLTHQSPNDLQDGLQLTGVAMVNLRDKPGLQDLSDLMKGNAGSSWGNKIGLVLLPVYYNKKGDDPLQCLKRAKAMIDRKKRSMEAHLSYNVGKFVMSCFGLKFASFLSYRIICNTSFTISNVVGPQEKLTIGGNPVTCIRATSTSLPHAITMHMVSYAGRADLQILVAKDVIHEPELLAECFEMALAEFKEAAAAASIIQ